MWKAKGALREQGKEEDTRRRDRAEAACTYHEIQTGGEGRQLDQTSGLLVTEQFLRMQDFRCQKEANQDCWSAWRRIAVILSILDWQPRHVTYGEPLEED